MNNKDNKEPLINMEEITKAAEKREAEGGRYTEEERKQIDAFYDALIKKELHPRVTDIAHYMNISHKKLDDLYKEIEEKRCSLSKLNRSFLISFERSFINSLFDKKYI